MQVDHHQQQVTFLSTAHDEKKGKYRENAQTMRHMWREKQHKQSYHHMYMHNIPHVSKASMITKGQVQLVCTASTCTRQSTKKSSQLNSHQLNTRSVGSKAY